MKLPIDSKIVIERNSECVSYILPKSKAALLRFIPAAFLIFWLCGWSVGEFFVIKMLFFSDEPIEFGAKIFLYVWLAGWTCGGFFAFRAATKLIKGPKATCLNVYDDYLEIHDIEYEKYEVKEARVNAKANLVLETINGEKTIGMSYFISKADAKFLASEINDWRDR